MTDAPVFSLGQLVDIIERSPKRSVKFQQISRQPGRERFRGLCPFHSEKTPSFDVFVGRDGKSRFYCQGCQEKGDAIHWLMKVEGRTWQEIVGSQYKPDRELVRRRELELTTHRRKEFVLTAYHDWRPDCCCPEWLLETAR